MLNKYTTWKTFITLVIIRLITAVLASANTFNLKAVFTMLSTITFILILIIVLNALGNYSKAKNSHNLEGEES